MSEDTKAIDDIIENVENPQRVSEKWDEYPLDSEGLHEKVISDFTNLANVSNYNERLRLYDLWTSVYHDRRRGKETKGLEFFQGYLKERLNRLNVIRDGCKRIMNRIVKSQPRPMYLSTGGSIREQKAGEDATDYMAAVFKKLDINKKSARQCLDSLVWGTGMLGVRGRQGKGMLPVAERVYPHDVLVDVREAMYGEPRHEFIQHLIPRAKLRSWVRGIAKNYKEGPSEKDLLHMVAEANDEPFTDVNYRHSEYRWSDMVRVVEALALPSMEGADDGKKAFVVSSGVMWGGKWEHMDDGIVRLVYSMDLEDVFFGVGVAEEGAGLFQALDDIMEKIEECHELMTSQVWLESGSDIKQEKMGNLAWSKMTYTGTKPDFMTPLVVSADTYAYAENLYDKWYDMLGTPSQAQDRPKSGQSGIAIQLEEDKVSGNLTLFAEDYEAARMKTGDYLLRELADTTPPDLAYTDKQKGVAKMISFSTVRANLDSLQSTIYPVSQMSNNPQGKIDQVERLLAMQVITPESAAEVMNWPDLKSHTSSMLAPRKLVDLYIDAALMGEKPGPNVSLPQTYMESRANDRLAEAEIKGATEDDLEGLRAWISLQNAAYAERAAQALAQQQAEIAAATPPPVPVPELETAGEPIPGGGVEAIPPGMMPLQ
jgi:hypothetical protein